MVFKYYGHIAFVSLSYSLYLHLVLFIFVNPIHPTSAAAPTTRTRIQPTKLVDTVCHTTSNYSFCVESLYTDPRTPTADRYVLAYISFGIAYLNASSTQEHIAQLLKQAGHSHQRQRLRRCYHDYNKAVSALQVAYNDLNSETFSELAELAGVASLAAHDCQVVLNTTNSPLTTMNHDLKGLCEICQVVSKLFTTAPGLAFFIKIHM